MALKVAYFTPTVIAADQVPPVEFSNLFQLTQELHLHTELAETENPFVNIKGGQHIQILPCKIELEITWLTTWIESVCQLYMDVITEQSGVTDLKLCKPKVTSIWTIRQSAGDYQPVHSHLGSNISGNIYITSPDFDSEPDPSNGRIEFKLPQLKDISRFVMADTWKTRPEPGTFVIFPSCLPHTVYPWTGTGLRTVVSFEAVIVPNED